MSGSNVVFNANSAATFATTTVGNVTVGDGITVTVSQGGTLSTGSASARTFNIGTGSTLNWTTQNVSTSANQAGFVKNGAGIWNIGAQGNAYNASNSGFTLNNGTVIVGGNNSFGGSNSVLTINGGTIQSSGTRAYANSSIIVGGNFENTGTGNATFSGTVALGSTTRTITNSLTSGSRIYSGVISGATGSGLTFDGSGAGETALTNAANTFTGDININGGEVRFTSDGSMGNAANDIIIDGGRFGKASDSTTVTLGAGRTISVGDGAGTSISSAGSGTLIYNGVIANKTGETGSWAKQGGGTLELGGVSTYTGSTAINNGTLRLTTGNNRLPTGTTVSLGQAASTNLGTLNLNGFNQEIAGLNSVEGTNATANRNTVTSVGSATLMLSGNGDYSYGSTGPTIASNSGLITGAISVVKNGLGTQTFGGANTYTGTTAVDAGTLAIIGTHTGGGAYTVGSGGMLKVDGTIDSAVNVAAGGTLSGSGTLGDLTISGSLAPGNSIGIINTGTVTWNGAADNSQAWEFELGPGNSSDLLDITGNFTKGSAGTFAFDFLGSTDLGTFTLASWTGSTDFSASDFSFVNLGGGNLGEFTFSGSNLQFNVTAVPEPSSLVILGMAGLGALVHRRRLAKKNGSATTSVVDC